MKILDWSGSSEVKELHCGTKPVVSQCWIMTCPGYYCDGGEGYHIQPE